MLSAASGDVGSLSLLHVGLSDQQQRGWLWPRLAVKTIAGDGMLILQVAGASVIHVRVLGLEGKHEQ